jgi:hypothetical protein
MSNMKDGKISISDRDKYRQMSVQQGSVLSVPEVLQAAFEEAGLASKWVSKAKIASHGGYHPSSWIPYEISAEQKTKLPKVFLGNVINSCLERGDLILAVKPKELQDLHKKELRRKTKQQLDSYYQEVDADGNPILSKPE